MNSITLKGVSHFYGDIQSLREVDLFCAPKEITCLLGPSGCGKSTLLRCIAGHEQPSAGSIALGDQVLVDDTTRLAPEARDVGMVFQDYALFPHLKVWQNVAFGLHTFPRKDRKAMALEVLERMEIAELAERYPHTCSGGQQQRVALARALARKPNALLLDEPFSGLDSGLRASLRHEVRELLLREDLPTILVTHDPEEALCCADQIVLMREGNNVQAGSPDHIWYQPADAQVMDFFSPIIRCPAHAKDGQAESPYGTFPADLPDGAYEMAVRVEALIPDPEGKIDYPILSQNACGGHRHISLAIPDGGVARFQVPNTGPIPAGTRFRLDENHVRLFPI